MRPDLRLFIGLLCTALPLGAAQAQATGFVHLNTHVPAEGFDYQLGTTRLFEQGPNGLIETFSIEYPAGPHTLARVESVVGSCRAIALNVSFTIVAGQWTEKDVPLQFQDCNIAISMARASGVGAINLSVFGDNGTSIPLADCGTGYNALGVPTLNNYPGCQGTVPYNAPMTKTSRANSAKSCCAGTDTIRAVMHNDGVLDFTHRLDGMFIDTAATHEAPPVANADLSITRTGYTAQGQIMVATFRIDNHGPSPAFNLRMSALPDSATLHSNSAVLTYRVTNGMCDYRTGDCFLGWLPVGQSTTFIVRYTGVPAVTDSSDASPARNPQAADIPTRQPGCFQALVKYTADDNQANNHADCVEAVPVTVTLGGNTPRNQTVAKGATDVPMLEFELNPASTETVSSVTVQAQGSGNEQVDVTAVNLWLDKNANGVKDAGDSLVSTGTFAANNGTVVLVVNPGLEISAPTTLLVTYSFSLTIAQRLGATSLILLGLCFVPVARRRKRLALGLVVLMLGIGIASCGGSSPTGPGGGSNHTYQAELTGLTVSGTDVTPALTGGTVTIPN